MDYDQFLEYADDFGLYQKLVIAATLLPFIACGAHVMAFIFISANPTHRCFIDGCDNSSSAYSGWYANFTIPTDKNDHQLNSCKMFESLNENDTGQCNPAHFSNVTTTDCQHWVYDKSIYTWTTSMEWELSCDREWLNDIGEAVFMGGVLFGALVFGYLSDKYGRRWVLLFTGMLSFTSSIVTPVATYYPIFLMLRFILAMAGSGMYQTAFVLSLEIVGKNQRVLCGIMCSFFFAIGELLLAGAAYLIRNWKLLQVTLSAPIFLFFAYAFFIPESVRWLLSKNQYTKARVHMEQIAKTNKAVRIPGHVWRVPEENENFVGSLQNEAAGSSSTELNAKTSMLELLRRKRLRWRTITIFLCWFTNTIVYYGLSLNATNLGGNDFANFAFTSAIELPAYVFCVLTLDRLGRKVPLCFCMILCGLSCGSSIFVPSTPEYQKLLIALSIIGKFGTSASFAIIYLFSAELFPTVVRNNAIGICSMIAHLGGVIAPFIATLGKISKPLPLIIFGVSSLITGLLSTQLPETLGQTLPETIADAEEFGCGLKADEGFLSRFRKRKGSDEGRSLLTEGQNNED